MTDIDVNDRAQLASVLNPLFSACRALNFTCAEMCCDSYPDPPTASEVMEQARRNAASGLYSFDHISSDGKDRGEIHEGFFDRAESARVPVVTTLDRHMWAYCVGSRTWLATKRLSRESGIDLGRQPVHYVDEMVDPIAIVLQFIREELHVRPGFENHHLQQWLRHQFEVTYNSDTKYAVTGVAAHLNALFYGVAEPSRRHLATGRSGMLDLSLLIHELTSCLKRAESTEDPENPSPKDLSSKQAAGVYLFLRFCRVLRSGFWWVSEGGSEKALRHWRQYESAQREQAADVPSGDAHPPPERLLSIHRPCPSLGGLRPIESSFLLARTFGGLYALRGLNGIFRGGMLPHTGEGRTVLIRGEPGVGKTGLALHMMADIASRGRFAVYFSLEESFESIVDHLVAFNLVDRSAYNLKSCGADLESAIQSHLADEARDGKKRGLLLLCRYDRYADNFLDTALDQINACAANRWPWRALAIDSINALTFEARADPNSEDASYRARAAVRSIVQCIEDKGFMGLLVSETGDPRMDVLPYLIDTEIELTRDVQTHGRYLEIRKCRSQDFHDGKNLFRVVDGQGIKIYPSLYAIRSRLRSRVATSLSERAFIPLPGDLGEKLGLKSIADKSTTLI